MAFQWTGKSADGKTITLHRLEPHHFEFPTYFSPEWEALNVDLVRIGAVVDVETTGLNQAQDQVIEVGVRIFKFNRETGEVLALGESYTAFQDPGFPLSAEITSITGITDEMVKGQAIDWARVDSLLNPVSLIVAHNASFDRPFIDRLSAVSPKKIWGCSFQQVNWSARGFPSKKLEILSIFHGFFNDSHRALNDADSLLYLLSKKNDGVVYLKELLLRAKKPMVHLFASHSPFESKDFLRTRNYRWDSSNKVWQKVLDHELLADEIKWLEEVVYQGAFRGRHVEISPVDQFKSR